MAQQQWWESAPVVAEKPEGQARPAVEFTRPQAPPAPPTPTRETERFVRMTAEEVEAAGLNPAQPYQRNQAGKIEPIGGRPLVAPDANREPQIRSALDALANIRKLAEKPLSVGETAGRLRSTPVIGALAGQNRADLEGALSQIEGSLIQDQLRELAKINPGGVASLANSETEARRLASSVANLDPNQSLDQFLIGVKRAEDYYNRQLGIATEETEVAPTTETAPSAARVGALSAVQPGEMVLTEQDQQASQAIQDAWNRTGNFDEVAKVAAQFGRTFGPQEEQFLRANAGRPVTIQANPTGRPTAAQEAVGAAVGTPAGEATAGYALGAANALTAGILDELAPVIGLAPEQVQAAKEYLRQRAPVSSFAGEVTGGALGSIPAVRGAGAALAGTRMAGMSPLAGEILYGSGYGAGEAPEGQRLAGAIIGGGSAGAGGALANRFLPGGTGTFSGMPQAQTQVGQFAGGQVPPRQVIEAGREAGIPVMTSDVRPPQTYLENIGQQVGEIVPLGTAGTRRAQQETREQAVENLMADVGVTIDRDIASDLVKNLNEKRSADLGKFSDMKKEVISKYTSAGDVSAIKSLDAIDNLLVKLREENLPRQLGGLIQQLEDVKASLAGTGNLQKIENNRATIFDLKGDPGLANISSKSEKAFENVYKALNEDMGDFIKANGNMRDFNRWKVANTKLAMMAGELKQGSLKRVLDKGDFNPATVAKMLTSANPQEVRLLFTNLGKNGRENARLLLLQTAAQRALNSDTKVINPTKFAKEVNGLKSNFGQFFGGAEAKRVNGLVAVLNATKRAQESQFAPRTGERALPFLTAGGFAGLGTLLGFDPVTGLASSAAFGAARRLYESPAVRDLLVRIGSAAESEKGKLISDLAQRVSSASSTVGATSAVGPETPAPQGTISVIPQ